MNRYRLGTATVGLLIGTAPATGLAQAAIDTAAETPTAEAPAGAAPAAAAVAPVPVAEDDGMIIVTAQRRNQLAQRVPIALSAFTAENLQKQSITTTEDVAFITPGYQIGKQLGSLVVNMRGIGVRTGEPGNESSVALYVDGFYRTDPRASLLELNNIQRIEVLKGPQGTLFGRNAAGGLVQVVTRTPTENPTIRASVGYGNYQTISGKLYASGGLSDGLAMDLAVVKTKQDKGYGFNLGERDGVTDHFAIQSKLRYDKNNLVQEFTADYARAQDSTNLRRKILPGAVGVGGYQPPAGTGFYDTTSNYRAGSDYRQWGVSSRTEFHTDLPFNVVNLMQYRKGHGREDTDQDGTPIPFADVNVLTRVKYYTEEFQLASNETSPFEWIIGAFYYHAKTGFDPLRLRSPVVASLNYDQFASVTTDSLSAFGQATVKVMPNTNLTAGIRYTHDKMALEGQRLSPTGTVLIAIPAAVENPKKSGRPTWRISVDHQFTPDIFGYLSYDRGYKSGIFAVSNLVQQPLDPETVDSYSGGLKTNFWGRRIRFNIDGFYYRWKNIQTSINIPGGTILENAALGEGYGVEAEFNAKVTDQLEIGISGSRQHTEYLKYENGTCYLGVNPSGGLIPMPLPPNGTAVGRAGVCDLSGNRFNRTPKYSYNLSATYDIPTSFGNIALSGALYRSGAFFWETENRLKQKAYSLVSAQALWTLPGDRFAVRIWGKNLTKTKYNIYGTSSAAFGDTGTAGPPRTYGIELTYNLN